MEVAHHTSSLTVPNPFPAPYNRVNRKCILPNAHRHDGRRQEGRNVLLWPPARNLGGSPSSLKKT
jgi:hypothetical protein